MDAPRDSANVLERIPVEIWNKIFHEGCGFTLEDFKTLCFVAPFFVDICQPMIHRTLTTRHVNIVYGYHLQERWGDRCLTLELDKWKVDMMRLLRAGMRLHFVASDPSLSTYPHTLCIGNWPCRGARDIAQGPPADKMVLSKFVCYVMLHFRATLTQTLPLFTRLRRLEISFFAIDDGLLKAIASHPVLDELKLGCCSFPSQTFPIPSIRVLGYSKISQKEAPAAFRLLSPQHLEELRIENMKTSFLVEDLCARPKSESTLTKLHRLTIAPLDDPLDYLDVSSLLSYVPALRQLDIVYSDFGENQNVIKVPAGTKALSPSTVPNLQQFSGSLSFARHVVPKRPVTHIQMDHNGNAERQKDGYFALTWPELQIVLGPLCLSSADRITTLHLPRWNVAPIWLLSRFVAETFPQLVDLKLPVGMAKRELCPELFKVCRSLDADRFVRVNVEGPFEDGFVQGMAQNIKESVYYELVGKSDKNAAENRQAEHDGVGGLNNYDYQTRRLVGSQPIRSPAISSPEVDVASTLVELGANVELNIAGDPSGYPKCYEEALFYFAQGWYPLPTTIQKTMCIGGKASAPDLTGTTASDRARRAQPPAERMPLSQAVYDAYLQFKRTLVQALPSFTHLRRLELSSLPIDDELLKAIASHPVVQELRFVACSFPSPTFPIPSIRLLEYDEISQEDIPAALFLVPPQHLQELRLKDMNTAALVNTLRARSACTKLQRLTIVLRQFEGLNLRHMEVLLCYVPGLEQLEIVCSDNSLGWLDREEEDVADEAQAIRPSTIPHLRRLSSPLSVAQYIAPGRPVSHIQMNHSGDPNRGIQIFVSTWPGLLTVLHPLCLSSATAEGITTLHLPNYNVAPIWLLSQFIAETFPRLVDLRLPVGMIKCPELKERELRWPPREDICSLSSLTPPRLLEVESPFEDGVIEGMVTEIRNGVDYELVGRFEDPCRQSMEPPDNDRKKGGRYHHAAANAMSASLKTNAAATFIELAAGIELDDTGQPSRHPKDYQEALFYFSQGWYPLPPATQTLSLSPGVFSSFPGSNNYGSRCRAAAVERETWMAILTALGELYPSLDSVTLIGLSGYRCQRIGAIERGKTTWTVHENDPFWKNKLGYYYPPY
ncbi:hypothetical protein H1R20_g2059, partial [Candolleomyces eurysporus]